MCLDDGCEVTCYARQFRINKPGPDKLDIIQM